MLRNSIYVLVCVGVTVALFVGTQQWRQRDDARRLSHEAEQSLTLPLGRAPELTKLPAARAVMLLEDALSLHDDAHSRGVLAWARALDEFQKARFERAHKALAEAQRALPDSIELQVLDAALALREGDPSKAAAPLARALAADPKHLRARLLAADLASDLGEPSRALALLEALVKEQPQLGPLYNRRGLAHEALGNLEAAQADYEQATLLDGSMAQPFINLGRLQRELGHAREAEAAFAQALERSDSGPEAWLGRGLSRIAQNDLAGGALDVQHARDLAPAEPAPLIALADIDVRHAQLDSALERYRAALTLAPSDAVAWLKLGNTLTRKRAYGEARDAFQRALALHPGLAAAHNGLGATLFALGDPANAEKAFATAAELDSHDPNPLRNLALLHKRQGNLRAAHDDDAEALARADGL